MNKAEKVCIFSYEDGYRGRDVLTNFLRDAAIKSVMTDVYNAYVFIGDELQLAQSKDTVHQVCLYHVTISSSRLPIRALNQMLHCS